MSISESVVEGGAACAYCFWRFADSVHDETTRCAFCQTPYHRDCYEENGGCVTFGCPAWTAGQLGQPEPAVPTPTAFPDVIFCTSCGSQLTVRDRFCDQCGTNVE